MRQKTIIAKLLQSASGITKCDRLLLESATVITNSDVANEYLSNNEILKFEKL